MLYPRVYPGVASSVQSRGAHGTALHSPDSGPYKSNRRPRFSRVAPAGTVATRVGRRRERARDPGARTRAPALVKATRVLGALAPGAGVVPIQQVPISREDGKPTVVLAWARYERPE